MKGSIKFIPIAENADKEVILKAMITAAFLHYEKGLGIDPIGKKDCSNAMESLNAYKNDKRLKFFVDSLSNAVFAWHKIFF